MSRYEQAPQPVPRKFFATAHGDLLIGQQSVDDYINAGGHPTDVLPLKDAMSAPGFEPAHDIQTKGWAPEDAKAFLSFYGRVLTDGTENKPVIPTKNEVNRAYYFGLTPGHNRLLAIIGSIAKIGPELNLTPQNGAQKYNSLTRAELISMGQELVRIYGDISVEILEDACKKGLCPYRTTFQNYFGRIGAFREILGLGIDIRAWSDDDYIEWGMDVMTANNGFLPCNETIDKYVDPSFRPSRAQIRLRFGTAKFRAMVEEKYTEKMITRQLQADGAREEFIAFLNRNEIVFNPDSAVHQFGATLFRLFDDLGIVDKISWAGLPSLGSKLAKKICEVANISEAELEMHANRLGVLEALYPSLKRDLSRYRMPDAVRRRSPYGRERDAELAKTGARSGIQ